MAEIEVDTGAETELTGFEAFGVRMYVGANRREAIERLPEVIPPGSRPSPVYEAKYRFAMIGDDGGTYTVDLAGASLARQVPLELALEVLDAAVRTRVALHSEEKVFVHAGVVAHGGRAILIPGNSFTGKTTLVAALVRAGAIYYSDEFGPLDDDGFVHAYAKPLSIRGEDNLQSSHSVEGLGGVAGDQPLPIGAVLFTTFRPGADWRPRRLSTGEGALAMLSHTVSAQERPEESLRAITRAINGATVLEGDRGEADAVAHELLAVLQTPAH